MSPIKGISEQRRLPRIGKIHLGIKKKSPRTGGEYPVATDYFVCPPEVQSIYGDKPKRLDVIIPLEDEEVWASQYYRQYSRSRGLVCKGDGVTSRRMLDANTGAVAGRDTIEVTWREGCECKGAECADYKGNACQEVMNLQFMLPKVPGLGIWQIDTGSIHSIRNINDCATMIRAMCGRVSWIPLTLTLEPTEVVNPDDGKKKTVYCMHLRYDRSAESLLIDSEKPRLQVLLGAPADDEAPDDRKITDATPEKREEAHAQARDDIEELFPSTSRPPSGGSTAKSGDDPAATGAPANKTSEIKPDLPLASDQERAELVNFAKEKGHTNESWKALLTAKCGLKETKGMTRAQYQTMMAAVDAGEGLPVKA